MGFLSGLFKARDIVGADGMTFEHRISFCGCAFLPVSHQPVHIGFYG